MASVVVHEYPLLPVISSLLSLQQMVLPVPYRGSERPGWFSPRPSTALRVLESSDEGSDDGDSARKTGSTAGTSPVPMIPTNLMNLPLPIGAVWVEAHACLLRVAEMAELLETATTQLTEVSAMLQRRVEIAAGSVLEETGSPTRRTSGEASPVAQVSREDLARVGEPTAEEVDRWFVNEAVRDAEWYAEQEQSSSSDGMD